MFRVLDLGSDGKPTVREGTTSVAPPPPGVMRWIDLVDPDGSALELLRERFEFHTLAIEDCATYGRQSKIDDYDRYLFLVVHGFTADPSDPLEIQIHEVHAFIGENYLVTVHENPLPSAELVWRRACDDRQVLERGPSWIVYLHVERIIDATGPLVERITDELDDLERLVIETASAVELPQVFRIKRTAVAMRRVIRPLRDTLASLHRRTDRRIAPRAMIHFRDISDEVSRIGDMVEEAREVSSSLVNAFHAVQSAKTNEVVKRLTIFSAVFLPLGFIVGFWGQNFHGMPWESQTWMWIAIASLVVVPAGLLEWFRRNLF